MGLVGGQGEHPDLTPGTSHSQNPCSDKVGVSRRVGRKAAARPRLLGCLLQAARGHPATCCAVCSLWRVEGRAVLKMHAESGRGDCVLEFRWGRRDVDPGRQGEGFGSQRGEMQTRTPDPALASAHGQPRVRYVYMGCVENRLVQKCFSRGEAERT